MKLKLSSVSTAKLPCFWVFNCAVIHRARNLTGVRVTQR
jgi:hypothetical protein